jgi:hypothetical protein
MQRDVTVFHCLDSGADVPAPGNLQNRGALARWELPKYRNHHDEYSYRSSQSRILVSQSIPYDHISKSSP